MKILAVIILLYTSNLLARENSCETFLGIVAKVNKNEISLSAVSIFLKSENGKPLKLEKCRLKGHVKREKYENELSSLISKLKKKSNGSLATLNIAANLLYITDGSLTTELLEVFTNIFYKNTEEAASFIQGNTITKSMFASIVDPVDRLIFGKNKCEIFASKLTELEAQKWKNKAIYDRTKFELEESIRWECKSGAQ